MAELTREQLDAAAKCRECNCTDCEIKAICEKATDFYSIIAKTALALMDERDRLKKTAEDACFKINDLQCDNAALKAECDHWKDLYERMCN